MTRFYDQAETQDADKRQSALFKRLPEFLQQAVAGSTGLKTHLNHPSSDALSQINSRETLAQLPVLRKPTLMAAQQAHPPYGGFAVDAQLNGSRIFMSPGPVWEPQPPGLDPWQTARSLFAAGIRPGQRVHNALSYHMTPGGFILDEGALALGCQVFPAGIGNTEQQVEAAAFYRPDAYVGTPDYLKVILDKAAEIDVDLSCIQRALVSGGALFPALREDYQNRGVGVLQAYATADVGVIAYESESDGRVNPGMIINENLIVEVVRPGTDDPVEDGEVGELVVTTFNSNYPLVRFGTGDLTAMMDGSSPCGRTNQRIRGWMGRADQRTKVKGMFVDPQQIARIQQLHPEINRARLRVGRDNDTDTLTLLIESDSSVNTGAVEATVQSVLHLRGQVEIVTEPLPNDGIVVADERDYS